MRSLALITTITAIVVTAHACGGKSPTAATAQATLTGTWRATRAEYVSRANSSVRVEVIAKGTTMVLALNSGGTYTLTITDPGQSPEVSTGTWTSSQDLLTMRPTGMSWNIEFEMALNGSTLTLNGGGMTYDVNGDNIDEETTLNMTLTKQ